PSFTFTPNDDGTYTVTLTVTDKFSVSGNASATLTVTNVPPTANPGGPYKVAPGGVVTLRGSATDPGSPPDSLTYVWDLNNDGIFGNDPGEVGQNVNFSAGSIPPFSVVPVSLKVNDDDAGVDIKSTTVTIFPTGQGNVAATLTA